uniref:BRISC and BRCA1-A complex member 2 n=1 Tax=Rhipicephalus appendiculatus TaxID=34631 RepID=A0A131YK15_RHIAP
MDTVFAPRVRCYLKNLLEHTMQNLTTPHPIRLVSASHGGPKDGTKQLCDRFKISLPYAGQTVTWEVIFQAHKPELPPDFIFDDTSFLPNIEEVPSLCEWDSEDDHALTNVIQELLEQYRKHQVSMLDDSPRLQFEYSSLVHQSDIAESNIQVHLNKKNPGSPVRFWITLPIDFSKLPPLFAKDAFSHQARRVVHDPFKTQLVQLGESASLSDGKCSFPKKENLSEDMAILQVTFQSPEGSRILPQLFLSPRVEALGGSLAVKLPSFNKDSCLMDYVPQVKELLEKKVEQVSTSFAKRKEYVAAFLNLFGRNLLEFDAEGFASLSFLFEHDDFFFILIIAIPRTFPQDKPSLTFQSAYHTSCGWPYSITCTDYPYSPRWEASEMADRARTFVMDYVPSFQTSSVKNR